MVEVEDLKSFQCEFESHHGHHKGLNKVSRPHIPIPPSQRILDYIKENYFYRLDGSIINKYTLNVLGCDDGRGYLHTTVSGKCLRLHHVAWFLCKGEWPKFQLDHEDLNPMNNKISNLREANDSLQNRNKRKTNKTGVIGAYKVKNGYQAQIWKDKQRYICGFFKTKEEAHEAYKMKYEELWGEKYI